MQLQGLGIRVFVRFQSFLMHKFFCCLFLGSLLIKVALLLAYFVALTVFNIRFFLVISEKKNTQNTIPQESCVRVSIEKLLVLTS